MGKQRSSQPPTGQPQGAPGASADKKPAGTPTEIPLGITQILPAGDLLGTLIPALVLQFDPRPDDVAHALGSPKALTLNWPITGKVANLRDCELPCQLQWQVEYDDKSPARSTNALGGSAKIKIDGSGKFEVLVGTNPPVLDLIAAGVVGSGTVGFTVTANEPPGALPQSCPKDGRAKFQALVCSVNVKTNPETGALLGDKVTYAFTIHELFQKTALTFYVVEQDVADQKGGGDKEAWKRPLVPGKLSDATWTIGYADDSGSWGSHFSYSEEFEEGGFELGWEIRAKCPSLPDKDPLVLVSSREPLKVAKPQLMKFQVSSADYDKGTWRAEGAIAGFSANGPRVRVALALVDRAGTLYPANLADATQVALDRDGKFKADLAGPKIAAPAPGQPVPPAVFAVLSLVATWVSKEKQNPISGFLGYDKNQFALFENTHKTGWDLSAAWICSEKSDEIAPRPKQPRAGGGGGGAFLAPPPSAGDPQDSELTLNEIAADLVASEGDVPYMYLDCYGYVTVGIGTCLVPGDKKKRSNQLDPSLAVKLPFKSREPGKPEKADEDDIRKAFGNVARMQKGLHPADRYLTHPHLELEHTDVLAEVQKYVDTAKDYLNKVLPGFDHFPKAARRAILDIVYNRGAGHFGPKKNYEIRKAVLVRDWKRAAEHVPRDGQASRRQWRMDCFAYAQAFDDSKKGGTA
jgi:GH24 family phage-related lysozyme (muramidase)